MEYDRRPVAAGALVQAVVLGGYLASIEGISPLAFALGVVGGMTAGGLTRRGGAWVNGAMASVVGCLWYLLVAFAVGSAVGIRATVLRPSDIVAVVLTETMLQGLFLLPGYLLLGMGAGALVGALRREMLP